MVIFKLNVYSGLWLEILDEMWITVQMILSKSSADYIQRFTEKEHALKENDEDNGERNSFV